MQNNRTDTAWIIASGSSVHDWPRSQSGLGARREHPDIEDPRHPCRERDGLAIPGTGDAADHGGELLDVMLVGFRVAPEERDRMVHIGDRAPREEVLYRHGPAL